MTFLKFNSFWIIQRSACAYRSLCDADRVFTNLYGRHDWHLKPAMKRGDWHRTRNILENGPQWIIKQIEKSHLLGRGGAGFPFSKKLKYMHEECKVFGPQYLVINGAEGEPGTCKDREIMRHEPQKLVEGALIVGRAINAVAAVIFIRGEFYNEACNLQYAILEAYKSCLLGDKACGSDFKFDIYVQRGAGNYICGEESALIRCLMASEGRPYRKPPYPTEKGLYDRSTLVCNVESIAYVPTICRRGGKWFAELGCPPHSTGTKLFNISGHVNRPCTVEEQFGIPLKELIEKHCGGVRGGWQNLLAVIPGGTSAPLISASQANNVKMDYVSFTRFKSHLGTGAVIVMDKSTDILKAMERTLRFYKNESCHQCTKCREASTWDFEFAERFTIGNGQPREIDFLEDISRWAYPGTICQFARSNANAVFGFIRHFRAEMVERMRKYANS